MLKDRSLVGYPSENYRKNQIMTIASVFKLNNIVSNDFHCGHKMSWVKASFSVIWYVG